MRKEKAIKTLRKVFIAFSFIKDQLLDTFVYYFYLQNSPQHISFTLPDNNNFFTEVRNLRFIFPPFSSSVW